VDRAAAVGRRRGLSGRWQQLLIYACGVDVGDDQLRVVLRHVVPVEQYAIRIGEAHDLGIGATSLGNWVRLARIDRCERPGLTTEERSELVRLRRGGLGVGGGGAGDDVQLVLGADPQITPDTQNS